MEVEIQEVVGEEDPTPEEEEEVQPEAQPHQMKRNWV